MMDNFIHKHNLNTRVSMFGHVDDYETLKQLYSSSLLSVSPGYVGLSITQSFGFGVPMLVSKDENHSPEVEAVQENMNAVFFKTDDMKSIDEQILNFYKNKNYWLNQRDSIVERCKKQYSIEAMSNTFIEVFNKYSM